MQEFSKLTFPSVIPDVIARYSNLDALGFVDETPITYNEMGKQIGFLRAFLGKLGLNKGDKVIIYSQNMPNWVVTYFALQCSGIISVPALPDFTEVELQNILEHSEAKAIFVSENLLYKVNKTNSCNLKHIIKINDFSIIKTCERNVCFNEIDSIDTRIDVDENDLATIIYTSGTTGLSKGVMLSHKNLIVNAIQGANVQHIENGNRFLSILPLSHTYENSLGLMLPILSGAKIFYIRKSVSVSVLLNAMKCVRPQFMLTVPMIIEKVYRQSILPKVNSKVITKYLYKFFITRKIMNYFIGKTLYNTFGGSLIFFGIGGAKLDRTVEKFLREAKFPYAIGYGLTETAPLLAGTNAKHTKLQAIGPAVIRCKLKINEKHPLTGEGEILAKGDNIMLGYYKDPELTSKVIDENGWFHTGDLGKFDRNGRLSHRGRLKNMIVNSNGENIYPEDVESLINNFKHVVESLVIEKKGKLVAMVYFNKDEISEALSNFNKKIDVVLDELACELMLYINSKVNKYSKIQVIEIQSDPFKKTATQKIKRYLYSN